MIVSFADSLDSILGNADLRCLFRDQCCCSIKLADRDDVKFLLTYNRTRGRGMEVCTQVLLDFFSNKSFVSLSLIYG